jgi:hypothetical protein
MASSPGPGIVPAALVWSDVAASPDLLPGMSEREDEMVFTRPPGPIRWELVAKPAGGTRRIAHLDPRDAAAYRRLVQPYAAAVERGLGAGAFANRTDPFGNLGAVGPARRRWRRAVARATATPPRGAIVVSDVRDCYGSIHPRALALVGIDDPDLLAFLRGLEDAGVRGLPVGPPPSAIIANAVLGFADRAVVEAAAVPIRWVDDVVLVGRDRLGAERAFDAWRRALASLGLEAHDGKTVRDPGRRVARAGPSASLVPARSHAIIASP